MVAYSPEGLVFRPRLSEDQLGLVNRVTPADARWKDLFQALSDAATEMGTVDPTADIGQKIPAFP